MAGLLAETLTPFSLEVALAVQQEIEARQEDAKRLRAQQVTRAQYEADLAGQRYRRVDPNNRLVASTLKAEWNAALRALQEIQQEYERHCQVDRLLINDQVREQIMALATDFPRVWNDPHTTSHDRKRLLRLLVEDVTLIKTQAITIHVRFRGGVTQTLVIPAAQRIWQTWETAPEVVQAIDVLLDQYTDRQIAANLNERGLRTGKGGIFHAYIVAKIRRKHHLKSCYERLREAKLLTVGEMARALHISEGTVKVWHNAGLLRGYAYNDKNGYLFEPPGPDAPVKSQGRPLADRRRFAEVVIESAKEVQYEA